MSSRPHPTSSTPPAEGASVEARLRGAFLPVVAVAAVVAAAAVAAAQHFGSRGAYLAMIVGAACLGALALHAARTARRLAREIGEAERGHRESEERYRSVFDAMPVPLFVSDDHGAIVAVNEAAIATYGYGRAELLAMSLEDLVAPRAERLDTPTPSPVGAALHQKKDGSQLCVETLAFGVTLGEEARTLTIAHDVSERVSLEAQLRHAQKMESIGRLAGGVAHDFNNVLSVIMSYTELALEEDLSDSMRADLDHVLEASTRARDLTRQLLVFSRRQPHRPRRVDIRDAVLRLDKVVRRLLGEDVALSILASPTTGSAEVDPAQLEQVVLNLVINARDAMPHGGTLTIETADVELDEAEARRHFGGRPGSYVAIRVQDTGIGMDRATRARIFEPFFTTKGTGKGTGLGLSTVFGIVKQSGGHVAVESEPKNGSSFWVYLPRLPKAPESTKVEIAKPPRAKPGERVLLVEDQGDLRELIRTVLEKAGYEVLEAVDTEDALRLERLQQGKIDLLLTDVVMPRMNGREVATRLIDARPETAVLYMSGYPGDVLSQHGVVANEVAFLEKPIVPSALLHKVREVLDAGAKSPAKATRRTRGLASEA